MSPPTESFRYFPGEIEDLIIAAISRLEGSFKTELLSCALVCRSWVPASRHYLFSDGIATIAPQATDFQLLVDLLQSPYCTLRPYLTGLRIAGKGTRESWAAVWRSLPQVHDLLSISEIRVQDPMMDNVIFSTGAPLISIKRAELSDVWKSDHDALLRYFCSLPMLEELFVRGCWPTAREIGGDGGLLQLPPSLRRLDVDIDAAENVFEWLLEGKGSQNPITSIKICRLWGLDDDFGLPNAMAYMELLGASLKEVEFHFDESLIIRRDIPLPTSSRPWFQCNTSLRVLRLSASLELAVQLLTQWFAMLRIMPFLEVLDITVTSWDAETCEEIAPSFLGQLDQQMKDRSATLAAVAIRNGCTKPVRGTEDPGWDLVQQCLLENMPCLRARRLLSFIA